jgi:hypothetical protein
MKRILLFIFLLSSFEISSQVSKKIDYNRWSIYHSPEKLRIDPLFYSPSIIIGFDLKLKDKRKCFIYKEKNRIYRFNYVY